MTTACFPPCEDTCSYLDFPSQCSSHHLPLCSTVDLLVRPTFFCALSCYPCSHLDFPSQCSSRHLPLCSTVDLLVRRAFFCALSCYPGLLLRPAAFTGHASAQSAISTPRPPPTTNPGCRTSSPVHSALPAAPRPTDEVSSVTPPICTLKFVYLVKREPESCSSLSP